MYIEPDSTIEIMHNVPLDANYENTLYFETVSGQSLVFATFIKYLFSNQMYQRYGKGKIRVEKKVEDLYDCNYLRFRNDAFGNKWFYAFIKSLEYVNNKVSEITYEIDVIQTWYFDFEFEKSFIERCHSKTDESYENTIPENLNLGTEYVCGNHFVQNVNPNDDGAMRVCILRNRKPAEGTPSSSTYTNGVYTSCVISRNLRASQPHDIDVWLDQFLQDDIITIYQYPNIITGPDYDCDIDINNVPQSSLHFGNYIAHNRKLMCYPFCQLLVSNNCGDFAAYKYEYFDHEYPTVNFRLRGVMATEPALILTPKKYKGIDDDYDDGIVMSNFPQCAWSGDTFKAWWAQNKNSYETANLNSVLSGITGVLKGAIMGAVAGGVPGAIVGGVGGAISGGLSIYQAVSQRMAQVEDIKNKPNRTFGSTQTNTLNACFDRYRFDFYEMKIKEEYARIIDAYFDKFGYAQNKIGIPPTKNRPHWTYCKTVGCAIFGTTGLPADDARKICNIFDNGITYWVNASEVGNYSLDNSPV